MQKDIAVVILNYIQFVNIYPGIKKLIDEGYSVDFYCENARDDKAGFKELFNDAISIMKSQGIKVFTKPQKCLYKVLLEPYPCNINIKHKYRIKYRYSNISAKPDIVYKPKNYLVYDAILCSGDYDSNYLSVFAKTFKTGNLKYINYKKQSQKHAKKVLLYLPTYGKESSIENITDELKRLKKDYYIIAKVHHGTSFLHAEENRIEALRNVVDEFYDLHKDLTILIARADVILTDNSGSIFEALYVHVPVAVFADDINKNKIGDFNTTQYELHCAGILPYTNVSRNIAKILREAQSENIRKLQYDWSIKYFYYPKNIIESFTSVVKKFLTDEIDKRYYEMHKVLKTDYYNLQNENLDLNKKCLTFAHEVDSLTKSIEEKEQSLKSANEIVNKQSSMINELETKLGYYENGLLYKIAKKIYKIKNGGK